MPDSDSEAEAAGGLKRTLKDLFAGAVGGVTQVLLGQSNGIFFFYHGNLVQAAILKDNIHSESFEYALISSISAFLVGRFS